MRPTIFTVALVGADGAGKTTVGRRLVAELPWPSTYMYMGINQDACNVLLPTTWLWLRWKKLIGKHVSKGGAPAIRKEKDMPAERPGFLRTAKSLLRVANLVAEEWFRQQLCWFAGLSGKIVIMDRHFVLDYYAHDIAPAVGHRSLANRIHGYMLKRFPVPDLIILLDASTDQLFPRKREDPLDALESRRQEYLVLKDKFPHFQMIDASQPIDTVVQKSIEAITAFRSAREKTLPSPLHPCVERNPA